MSKNYERIQNELLEQKERVIKGGTTTGVDFNMFEKKFDKMFEIISYQLLTEDENKFYGSFLTNATRRKAYAIGNPFSHQVCNSGLYLLMNPMIIVENDEYINKLFLKHEVVHIVSEHFARIEELKDRFPKVIALLASDLVANYLLEKSERNPLPSDKFWTSKTMEDIFEMKVKVTDSTSIESLTMELFDMYTSKQYPKFNEFVDANNGSKMEKFIQNIMNSTKDGDALAKALQQMMQDGGMAGEEGAEGSAGAGGQGGAAGANGGVQYSQDKLKGLLSSVLQQMGGDSLVIGDMIKRITIDAATQSRGILPGGLAGIINKMMAPPVITWQEHIRRFIAAIQAGKKQTIFRKNRRQPNRVDLKGEISDKELELFIAIDTSGSVSDKMVAEFMTEIFAITKLMKKEVTIIECDSRINKVYKAKNEHEVDTEILGRGGTEFSPVIEYINKNGTKDAVLIYMTDGYGESQLSEKPKFQGTLWLVDGAKECLSLKGANLPRNNKVISLKNK